MTEITKTFEATRILLTQGDITKVDVDAIVNAANSGLLGGGGVDGAIHRAGGPRILDECKAIRKERGGCPTGQAVITGGGNLPARHVIHAVGPVWKGGSDGEAELLAGAYQMSLSLATAAGLSTVAFPSISTGAYGYPVNEAARVALSAVKKFCATNRQLKEIRFVLFDARTFQAYSEALESA